MDIIGIKPSPDDLESNFKKVGAIPMEPYFFPYLPNGPFYKSKYAPNSFITPIGEYIHRNRFDL